MAKQQPTSGARVYFTSEDNALPLPNLIAHQKDSWQQFVEDGLSEIFSEINPIDDYTGQKWHCASVRTDLTSQRRRISSPRRTI